MTFFSNKQRSRQAYIWKSFAYDFVISGRSGRVLNCIINVWGWCLRYRVIVWWWLGQIVSMCLWICKSPWFWIWCHWINPWRGNTGGSCHRVLLCLSSIDHIRVSCTLWKIMKHKTLSWIFLTSSLFFKDILRSLFHFQIQNFTSWWKAWKAIYI